MRPSPPGMGPPGRLALGMVRATLIASLAAAVASILFCAVLVVFSVWGSDPPLRRALGLSEALPIALPRTLSIVISPHTLLVSPRVAVAECAVRATFTNELRIPVLLRTASLSPSYFSVRLASRAQVTVRLAQPGLYHYYDALVARPRHVVAGNDVIVPRIGAPPAREGWIAVVCSVPGLRQELLIPRNHDLFAPKVLVATVGSTIEVSNRDKDAHNFVIDPHSPAGAAFVVAGTDTEPPYGWQRALVVHQAGLYHVYCTFHAHVIGVRDGWRLVVPHHDAGVAYETSGDYTDHNPMEAWIIVLPATVIL